MNLPTQTEWTSIGTGLAIVIGIILNRWDAIQAKRQRSLNAEKVKNQITDAHSDLAVQVDKVQKVANGPLSLALATGAQALRALANQTNNPEHIRQAAVAEAAVETHIAALKANSP